MAFRPSLQIASQSSLDCSDAQGLVSSIYNGSQKPSLACIHPKSPTPSVVQTHVVHTKLIQSLGDLDLLLGVKKGVGELLPLTKGALDDLEPRNIAQEVRHSGIVAVGITTSGRVRVLTGLDTSESGVGGGI